VNQIPPALAKGDGCDTLSGLIHCFSHGFPTPLARWHHHDVHELHIITSTSGQAFVGDWIGPFHAGHVVLVGPRLPHNWVSMDVPVGGVVERDLVIQFDQAPLLRASATIPELADLSPLLERASNGIEFFGMSDRAVAHWRRTQASQGLRRWVAFCEFMADLATCTHHRVLSSMPMQGGDAADILPQLEALILAQPTTLLRPISVAACAVELGMSASRFSRCFRRATGNTFTDFVNRVRIHRAGQLLAESDRRIVDISGEVGFQNVANFNRRFLEIQGMTPSEFRRRSLDRGVLGR